MKAIFAQVSNVERLLAGVNITKKRGAREAGWILVTSEPGYGKTETLLWYVTQEPGAIYLRAKQGWRAHWFLRDLLETVGVTPQRHTEDMFRQAQDAIAEGAARMLILDEVEHALGDGRVLEALRDLSDITGIVIVLVGMGQAREKIRTRYPQIYSRVATVVHFQPVSEDDIRAAASQLLDGLSLADDVIHEIHANCEGRMRLVMNALANCERIGKPRKLQEVTLADLDGQELIHDWKSRTANRVVKLRRA